MGTYYTVVLLVALFGTWSSLGARNFRRRDKIPKKVESITPCFLAEYATWRKLEQVVLFVHKTAEMMDLVKSMSRRGVLVGLKSMTDPQLPSAVHIPRHRLGAIILVGFHLSPMEEEFLEQVSQKQLFHAYVSWLVLAKKISGFTVDANSTIEERLKYLNIGPDTELIIATLLNRTEEQHPRPHKKHNRSRFNDSTNVNDNLNKGMRLERDIPRWKETSYGRRRNRHNSTDENNANWNRRRKGNRTRTNPRNNDEEPTIPQMKTCREYPNRTEYAGLEFSLSQVYKIRPTLNTTLISSYLGSWNVIAGTSNLAKPTGIEQHKDFQGQPLIVGIKNVTQYLTDIGGSIKNIPPPSTDDEMEDDNRLMDLLDFITRSLNATYELVPFTKLGWRNEEKAWLFMLGAVTSGTVDLGLDNVVITKEKSSDMFFTLPIVQSMKNIYFRRPESSVMRDIFLAPFSPKLLLCVAVTGIIIATAMLIVNVSIAKCENKVRNSKNKSWSLGEAIVWSVSVLCMQGSSWNPKSLSGCLVLIFSLCFALVIYNAYAAFITSVLSVRVASIRGLGDLLESDFQFGYTLRGQDESFLRTVNDTALRRLYFRGLVKNHGVAEASAGLQKASTGGYAFFVSARLARKALNSFIAQDKRCDIQELTVEATKSAIALPMGLSSPYKRLINLSLLRMREAGVLGPIQERMLPPMPPCKSYSAFNSASITDVYSAFLVFGGGLATAVFMGLSEKVWKRRASLVKWIMAKWANRDKIKILLNEPEPRYPVHAHTRKRSRFRSIPWFD